ncbi:hypothetical protein F383_00246 [Gossypium arboreum]|uniref:Uncharacterized protein n=1 Tax=Gossypium arboreum TaxID=29729 RepID=A0A0B0NIJ8_GOSAR|nr:hypothetical protein F383_00246 [Gossypium arboreum]
MGVPLDDRASKRICALRI